MGTPISYARMRRILGLPAVAPGGAAAWTVRKIRTGDHAGRWGVWNRAAGTAAATALVCTCPTWRDAIDHVGRGVS